jgi:predicted nuclease of predicted toxin-antitoxin system
MKRVLLDQGLAPKAAVILRAEGWDAVHVMEAGLANAEDMEIPDFAEENRRVCVTFDHDFHAHLALARANGPSVILIRVEGLNSHRQAELIQRVWSSCSDAIDAGAAVSVDEVAIRVRNLPLR